MGSDCLKMWTDRNIKQHMNEVKGGIGETALG